MLRSVLRCAWIPLFMCACESGGCPSVDPPEPGPEQQVLLDPTSREFTEPPPDTFRVRMATTKGDVVIEVVAAWAPAAATRFYNLVRHGFYDGSAFFRVVPGFVAQFGVSPIPAVQQVWDAAYLPAESTRVSNTRWTVTFAQANPNTRSTQLFINYGDNSYLDGEFPPFGRVVEGSGALLALYSGYGELPPDGNAPSYGCMLQGGSAYLDREYPQLDRIVTAEVEPDDNLPSASASDL